MRVAKAIWGREPFFRLAADFGPIQRQLQDRSGGLNRRLCLWLPGYATGSAVEGRRL